MNYHMKVNPQLVFAFNESFSILSFCILFLYQSIFLYDLTFLILFLSFPSYLSYLESIFPQILHLYPPSFPSSFSPSSFLNLIPCFHLSNHLIHPFLILDPYDLFLIQTLFFFAKPLLQFFLHAKIYCSHTFLGFCIMNLISHIVHK